MAERGTSEQLAQEIDSFKEDIRQLQRDLSDILASAGTYSREKLHESHQRVRAALSGLKYQAEQKAADVYGKAVDQGAYAVDKSRRTIEEKPLTAVAIAFCAGLVLSWFTERRSK
jgi:ElaB/YqjD/DUF883 family membrane-anchored ribosome-binding protein